MSGMTRGAHSMATFTGSTGADTITPGLVSGGVGGNPLGSLPSAGADSILGNGGTDVIDGGGGLDTVRGGAGSDVITVRTGGRFAGEGDGDLFLVASAGAGTTIDGGASVDSLDAQGALSLVGTTISSVERLLLDGSALTLNTSQLALFTTILAAGGATMGRLVLNASGSATTDVQGLSVLDVNGGIGADLLTFTTNGAVKTGIDVAAGFGADSITTADGDDTLSGGSQNDTLAGGAGEDALDGGTGADSLVGGSGNDSISFGDGDQLDPGDGDDLLVLVEDIVTALSSFNAGNGIDTLQVTGPRSIHYLTTFQGIERLALGADPVTMLAGTLGDFDTITGAAGITDASLVLLDQFSAQVAVEGLASLTITTQDFGIGLNLRFNTATTRIFGTGGASNDIIRGGDANDVLSGGLRDDDLIGGLGADRLEGGDGNDVLRGNGISSLSGDDAADTLLGGAGRDVLHAEGGDSVDGGDDDDTVLLQYGAIDINTTVLGGSGMDSLATTAGPVTLGAAVMLSGVETLMLRTDLLTVMAAHLLDVVTLQAAGAAGSIGFLAVADAVTATLGTATSFGASLNLSLSAGSDSLRLTGSVATTVVAGDGNDTITTGTGADSVDGGIGKDRLGGGDGNDTLRGGSSADVLSGGVGNDLLVGGASGDRLTGGDGADRFRYDSAKEGKDTIGDFLAGTDLLEIRAAGFGGGLVAGLPLAPAHLVVVAGATATAATGQFLFDTTTATLSWDVDGTGLKTAVALAALAGVAGLATTDFVLV